MLRRSNRLRRNKNSVEDFNQDYYTTAYYLYHLLKDEQDIDNSTLDYIAYLIIHTNLEEHATKVLKMTLEELSHNKGLKPLSSRKSHREEKEDDFEYFDRTEIPMKYTIDKFLGDNYTFSNRLPEIQINFVRCFYASEEPVGGALLARIFFIDEKDTNTEETNEKVEENQRLTLSQIDLTKDMSLISRKKKAQIFSTKSVDFLIKNIGLSKEEALFIKAKFYITTNGQLSKLYRNVDIPETELFSSILNITKVQFRKMTREDKKIISFGLIDCDGDMPPELIDCILDQSMAPYFSDYLKPLDCSNAYDEETFSVPASTTKVISNLLQHQDETSILLYGKPGSGKTEYSKMLANKTGYKTFIYKNERDISSGIKAIAVLNCYLSIKQKDTIIIVDEADKLLQTVSFSFFGATPTQTKGTVNKMLEDNKNKIIWIINHSSQLDESTRRRFTMSYKFDEMPLAMLRKITKSKLDDIGLDSQLEEKLIDLLNKYSVTGASVENIAKTISSLKAEGEDEETLIKSVKTVLEENAKLLDGNTNRIRETVSKSYKPEVINTSVKAEEIVNMVKNAIEYSQENKSCENGIRMLFYGASGTGKTELVRYMAEKLNKQIIIQRASDILGKYVGETEASIKAAFQQAAQEDKILLFDEADSFFANRENANTSWERTMTNEFLTQMEEFPGILVCTTNMKNIMDPAMQRRFQILVEFKPLEKPGIKTLLESYFSTYSFTDSQIAALASLGTVTPGDFGALSSRIRFMNKDSLSSSYIATELEKLQQDKEGSRNHSTIGFTAN